MNAIRSSCIIDIVNIRATHMVVLVVVYIVALLTKH